jgi:hypothetical protein
MMRSKTNSRGQVRGETVLRTSAGGPFAGRGPVPTGLRANKRHRRLGFARSLAFAGARYQIDDCRGQGGARVGSTAKSPDQDSWHQGGFACDRRGDLRGIPINVTLLFSDDQYLATVDAFMRGIERRIAAGLSTDVRSVASVFVSRWDVAVAGKVPEALNNQLGIAVARRAYKAYLGLLSSPGCAPTMPGRARNGSYGPAQEPRIQRLRTSCTLRPWPHHSPSTPCPRARCTRLPSTALSRRRCRWTAVRRGGDRCPCAVGPASRRRRQVVRQFMERPDGRI